MIRTEPTTTDAIFGRLQSYTKKAPLKTTLCECYCCCSDLRENLQYSKTSPRPHRQNFFRSPRSRVHTVTDHERRTKPFQPGSVGFVYPISFECPPTACRRQGYRLDKRAKRTAAAPFWFRDNCNYKPACPGPREIKTTSRH